MAADGQKQDLQRGRKSQQLSSQTPFPTFSRSCCPVLLSCLSPYQFSSFSLYIYSNFSPAVFSRQWGIFFVPIQSLKITLSFYKYKLSNIVVWNR